jgi:hypothetical protein
LVQSRDRTPDPAFILIHSKDIRQAVNELGLTLFENRVRSSYGECTALLYISGKEDPIEHFIDVHDESKRKRPEHRWSHWHLGRLLPEEESFVRFVRHVERLLYTWKLTAGSEPPKWNRLHVDWASEVSDAASALLLRLGPDEAGEGAAQRLVELFKDSWGDQEIRPRAAMLGEQGGRASALLAKLYAAGILDQRVQSFLGNVLQQPEPLTTGAEDQNKAAALASVESARFRFHHDHFLNGLINCIGPGWEASERLRESDMVLKALCGDTWAGGQLRALLEDWRENRSPALEELIAMGERVDPPAFSAEEIESVRAADALIRGLLESGVPGEPRSRAGAFWRACECIDRFVAPAARRAATTPEGGRE